MSEFSKITWQQTDAVVTLTLNRPQKLNALTDQTNIELSYALDRIAADPNIRIVILAAAGRAFCAGYDVGEGEDMPARTPAYWVYHFGLAYTTLRKIWSLPQPVVAKVKGACLGGGLALAMACDLTYASDDAFFGDAEIKFGGGGNVFPVMQWTLPMKLFNELMLTGRVIRAPEAASRAIINEMLPAEDLDARVDQIVRHMGLLPPGTLVRNKASARRVYDIMGLGEMVQTKNDTSIVNLSAQEPGEFTRISKQDGVTAALRWQKARFAEVGAYE